MIMTKYRKLALAALMMPVAAAAQKVDAPGRFVPQQAISFGAAGTDAVAVDAAHPLPVAPSAVAVDYVDRSGAILAANVAQPVA
uniref:hypothetical protein n=1 Tax=Sphingomonas bacterium TaxID=1895847 RepID=UPI00157719C1